MRGERRGGEEESGEGEREREGRVGEGGRDERERIGGGGGGSINVLHVLQTSQQHNTTCTCSTWQLLHSSPGN